MRLTIMIDSIVNNETDITIEFIKDEKYWNSDLT